MGCELKLLVRTILFSINRGQGLVGLLFACGAMAQPYVVSGMDPLYDHRV